MNKTYINDIYKNPDLFINKVVTLCGFLRTIRSSKTIGFIELSDGSCFRSAQIVFENEKIDNYNEISRQNVGCALVVHGILVLTPEAKQPFEIKATKIEVEGESTADYPLQKKRHSLEFLRTIPHLRARTNTFSAAYRIRSKSAFAIHSFFNERDFVYIHTPVITDSDCEGAGEMFTVTTLDIKNPPLVGGKIDYSKDFFGAHTSLTVSGQLEGEYMAQAFSKIYTFGPTFRAENSNTPRHAAEFWMIEPEMAFADLFDDMALAKDMIQYIISYVLKTCPDDMQFFNDFYDNTLLYRLETLSKTDFCHITYTEAINILQKHKENFEYPVNWGSDLQTEHERFLSEKVFEKPVFVTDYPKDIKSFYMRLNDDNKTVAAMDLLVPGVGEIIGGSQREERMDFLVKRMNEMNLPLNNYQKYLDIRKYGSTKHAGFGLGFDRLLMYMTGITNIRDIIPFPRTTGNI